MAALASGGNSTLNPYAPLFIPASFRQVEDFSPEWWQLITTSTWYHNYWLSQHQDENGLYDNAKNEIDVDNAADFLPETFDLDVDEDIFSMEAQFEEFIRSSENEREFQSTPNGVKKYAGLEINVQALMKNLNGVASLEGKAPKPLQSEPARYAEKQTKHVNLKYSPRHIQQPR